MSAALSVWVKGIGVWAPGAADWDAFCEIAAGRAGPAPDARPNSAFMPLLSTVNSLMASMGTEPSGARSN